MFSKLTILATVAAMLSSTSASPISRNQSLQARDFNCNVENVRCCEQTMSHKEAQKQFGGLLLLDGLVGNIGLSCNPIGIDALSSCKSAPVCCSQVSQSGLVNAGCSPLTPA